MRPLRRCVRTMIIPNYAIKFRTAVIVFTAVFSLAGIRSYLSLPREGAPDITIPYVFITAAYEGTAPAEVEKLIAIPLEKKLKDVENVKELKSVSSESFCMVMIEFVAGEDIDLAKQRVKDKVDLAKPDLPSDLDEPVVDAFNFGSDFPVFIFAISGATDLDRLKNIAEAVQEEIEALPGAREAAISGVLEREIRVEMDLERMAAQRIPLSLALGRIASENKTISAGNIEIGGDKFQVRVPGEFELASEMRAMPLAYRNGKPVFLGDVARVRDTYKDRQTASRLNGEPVVSLSLKKRSGVNTVGLIREVKGILDGYPFPEGVGVTVVMDSAEYIDTMIRELENNIATGFLLVVFVLFLFLGIRNSIFVGLAIPLSMLIAFTLLDFAGKTLNMIVLFSLVLAVGMLVDNAIVIVENIYRNRCLGLPAEESARKGASEVAWPVITSTLTTLAAFAPLLFWPGIMGQFMGFLPRTLITVLSASLFVALVINPALSSALMRVGRRGAGGEPHPFVRRYVALLRGAIRHRAPVVVLGVAVLVFTFALYALLGKGAELFPSVPPRNCQITVKFPQGTSLERTDRMLRDIEGKLTGYEDVKFFLSTAGSSGGGIMSFGGGSPHTGSIHVEFVDAGKRKGDSSELINRIRDDIGAVPGAEIQVEKEQQGPPTGAPVAIEVSGDDFEVLSDCSAEVMRSIENVPGLVDLLDDMEDALPEIQLRIDRHRAALLGLDTAAAGMFLRMAIYGLEAGKLRAGEDEYDITLRLPEDRRQSMMLFENVLIPTQSGAAVPLSSLGSAEYTAGRGSINRKNRKRVVTITGNDTGRGVDKILRDIRRIMSETRLPAGYSVAYTGENKEMVEAMTFLSRAFAVAAGLILVILVMQFNSVLLPLIIFISVVFSLSGVLAGLMICGLRFGIIMTGLGIISLAGIVVNNAIVLIDCAIQRRKEGLSAGDAIIEAGRLRLRPVLLTATTTILGLIPMAVGYSLDVRSFPPRIVAGAESGAWWAPMAVAVIFGLAFATVLTLLFVPVLYSLTDSASAYLKKRFSPVED